MGTLVGPVLPGTGLTRRFRHIPELDGIRGIAVGLVLLFHLWPNAGPWTVALPYVKNGWIGVDLFFVLSGFLITRILLDSVERQDYYTRFYRRRVFRIFPLYYLTLTSIVVFMAFWHSGHYLTELRQNWGSPGWFFVYLANEVRPHNLHFELFAPLAPMWSLQIEEQFYLVFPFVIRQARRKVWAVVLAFILGPFVWRTVSSIFDPAHAYLLYSGTFARIDELAAGALAAYLLRDAPQKVVRQASRVLACILVPSVILIYFVFGIDRDSFFNNTVGYSLCACAFASLILWTVYASGTRSTAILRNPTLRYLGKISYGVYLLQLPLQSAIKIVLHKPLGSPHRTLLDFLVSVSATVLLASLSFKWFEKPILDWGTKGARPRSDVDRRKEMASKMTAS